MNLLKKLVRRVILGKGSQHQQQTGASDNTQGDSSSYTHQKLERELFTNEQQLRQSFSQCSDVVFRKIPLPNMSEILIVFIDGLVDTKMIDESVLNPIILGGSKEGGGIEPGTADPHPANSCVKYEEGSQLYGSGERTAERECRHFGGQGTFSTHD